MIKKCALFFLLGMFCISELSADPPRWLDARTFSLRAANQLPVTALSFPEEIVSPGQYYGALLGLDASSELRITSRIEDRAGRNFRFQQYYRGLQVFGARLVVNEHSDGRIKAMGGRVAREIDLDSNLTQGSLTAARALNRALEHYRAEHGEEVLVSESESTLVVAYADDRYHLAFLTWAFGRTSESGLPVRPTALVDVNSGEIIQAWDSLRR